MTTRTRTSRAEWRKRIERWRESGLSAEQFAAELGVNVGTLRHWKYFLAKEGNADRGQKRARKQRQPESFVEIAPAAVSAKSAFTHEAFELEIAGRRVRIPSGFEAEALSRLIAVLERA
jgi:hypothetical protein